jgi:hypothetical protein
LSLDLARPRALGELFRESLRVYFGNFARLLAISAAVVVPTELIVSGVGLGELTSGFDGTQSTAASAMDLAVQGLVITPLVVAMTVYLLLDLADGKQASLRRAVQSGLDAFAAVFVPVAAVLAAEAAIVLLVLLPALLTGAAALVPLILVAVFLGVRWYFVVQAVVVERARRLDALRASWELTRGVAWRVFGTVAVGVVVFGLAASVVSAPLAAAARSADSGVLFLASQIVSETLAAPAVALLSAFLYFDLAARRGGSRN